MTTSATLREWREAQNVYAYYAQPYPEYYNVQRVLFWALVGNEIVGLISTPDGLVPAFDYEPGEFVDYYRLGVDPETFMKNITAKAQARGQEMYYELHPQVPGHRARTARPSPAGASAPARASAEAREVYTPLPPMDEPEPEELPLAPPPPRRVRSRGRRTEPPTSE